MSEHIEYRYYENLENIPEIEGFLNKPYLDDKQRAHKQNIDDYVATRKMVNHLLLKMSEQLGLIASSLDPEGATLLEVIKYQENSYYHRYPKGVFDE
jgi:hypothetical protein